MKNTKRLSEELIYQQLIKLSCINQNLAKYRKNPAIFYQLIPHDKDKGWDTTDMFPRISYTVDWQYNEKRKSNGVMQIDICCTNENETTPEEFAREIEDNLSELFLTDESGTYCFIWNRSDSFIDDTEPVIFGISIYFDVIHYPNQEKFSYPVYAINQFIKEMQPNCIVLEHGEVLPATLRATDKNPIIYVEEISRKTISETYAMSTMEETLSILIFSFDTVDTGLWIKAISNDLHEKLEIPMKKYSSFLIENINEQMEIDPFRTGRITVIGDYRVMKNQEEETKLNHVTFNR